MPDSRISSALSSCTFRDPSGAHRPATDLPDYMPDSDAPEQGSAAFSLPIRSFQGRHSGAVSVPSRRHNCHLSDRSPKRIRRALLAKSPGISRDLRHSSRRSCLSQPHSDRHRMWRGRNGKLRLFVPLRRRNKRCNTLTRPARDNRTVDWHISSLYA